MRLPAAGKPTVAGVIACTPVCMPSLSCGTRISISQNNVASRIYNKLNTDCSAVISRGHVFEIEIEIEI